MIALARKLGRPVALASALTLASIAHLQAQQKAQISGQQARDAANTLAEWAIETENPDVLAAALELAFSGGATLDQDDPWSMADFAQSLAAMPGGAALLAALDQTATRGVISGTTRFETVLAPGAHESVTLTVAREERAVIEARLKRGSTGADLDVVVFADDVQIAAETGPESGIEGVGVYIEFFPETCMAVTVEISNLGQGTANAVFLAPASSLVGCDG